MFKKLKKFLFYDIQNKIIKLFTRLSFYIIFLLISTKLIEKILIWTKYQFNFINIELLFSFIWAIIVFWYWYKKHESDKEKENIDKFLIWNFELKNIDEIQKWKIWFLFYKKWSISNEVWEMIEWNNMKIFYDFLKEYIFFDDYKEFLPKIEELSLKLSSIFILNWGLDFKDYMMWKLDELYKEWKNIIDKNLDTTTKREINFNKMLWILIDSIKETNKKLYIS